MDIKSLPRALLFSMIVIAAISLNGSAPVTQPTMVLRHGDPGPIPSWVEMLAERKMADDGDTCDEIRELILKERKLLDQWRQGQAGSEAALAEFIRTSSARQVPGVHTDSALQYCLFWMRRDRVLRLSPKEGLWILYYLEEEFGNDAAYKAFLLQMQRLMNDGRTSVGGYVQEQLQRIISLCTETADDVDVKFDE